MQRSISSSQPILIVEDSDDDYETTELAFRESNLLNPLYRAEDGREALDFLYHKGEYADKPAPRPGIILLDLNLPGIDGRKVLETLKNDPDMCDIPVVILTTSSDERDIEKCYQIGANSYVQKPVDLNNFMIAIRRLKEYWFEVSIIPNRKISK